MTDIVERLRDCDCGRHCKSGCIQEKAAAEIERLRAEAQTAWNECEKHDERARHAEAKIEQLRAALQEIVRVIDEDPDDARRVARFALEQKASDVIEPTKTERVTVKVRNPGPGKLNPHD